MPTGWQPKYGAGEDLRKYLEKERSSLEGPASGYYLKDGEKSEETLAERHIVSRAEERAESTLTADQFDRWLEGADPVTGEKHGQRRQQHDPTRRQVNAYEHIVSVPKSLSALAAVDSDFAILLRGAQERQVRAVEQVIAENAVVRRGPAGEQVQVPVERIETVTVWHSYSRAGDPQPHAHLFVNAKVQVEDGSWRSIDSRHLLRGLCAATNAAERSALTSDPELARALAERGWTQDKRGGIKELEGHCEGLSSRQRQIEKHTHAYMTKWEAEHPCETPGRAVHASAQQWAWNKERPAKNQGLTAERVRQHTIATLAREGIDITAQRDPVKARAVEPPAAEALGRDAVRSLERSAATWTEYDVKAAVHRQISETGWTGSETEHQLLAKDGYDAARLGCRSVLSQEQQGVNLPLQKPSLTSERVMAVEDELARRIARRAEPGSERIAVDQEITAGLSLEQREAVEAIASNSGLTVIEGAAGTGKTHMLGAARRAVEDRGQRMRIVAPSRVAAEVAGWEVGARGDTVHGLLYQHGVRWDKEGNWRQLPVGEIERLPDGRDRAHHGPREGDRLTARTHLVVDEAGMLGQDEALWLLRIADAAGAEVTMVGDRRQLAAVGRPGTFDLAANLAADGACAELVDPQRFNVRDRGGRIVRDEQYSAMMRAQRVGESPEQVFDLLLARRQIRLAEDYEQAVKMVADHAAERRSADLAADRTAPSHVVPVATNGQACEVNEEVRARLVRAGVVDDTDARVTRNAAGDRIGAGDLIVTRSNHRDHLTGEMVMNRQLHTVLIVERDGSLRAQGADGQKRTLPARYVAGRSQDEQETPHVQHGYAQTIHGAQGLTADSVEGLHSEQMNAAGLYVTLTRGRTEQSLVIVADSPAQAREAFVATTGRDAPAPTIHRAREEAQAELDRHQREPGETGRDAPSRVVFDAFLERERIEAEMRDPLADVRLALGPDRAGQLPELTDIDRMTLRDMTERELAQRIDVRRVPPLDRTAAVDTWRLERDVAAAVRTREQAREQIDELQQHRIELGFLKWRERCGIEADLRRQRRIEQNTRARIDRDERQIEAYREAGRHPDQWVQEHGAAAVQRAGTIREQQVRQELEIRRAQEIAVLRPPEHVRALLGERAPEDRKRYDSLSRDLERHRIEHGIDIDRDGALGRTPSERKCRGDYAEARRALIDRVVEHRHDRGLDVSGAQFERVRDTGRDIGLDL